MAWLVRDGEVLATCDVLETARGRARGLLGRDGIEGAIILQPARSIHTFGMRFPIDAAFVDRAMTVRRVVSLRPNRLSRPVWSAHGVIEAEAGAFARWCLEVGDKLEVRG